MNATSANSPHSGKKGHLNRRALMSACLAAPALVAVGTSTTPAQAFSSPALPAWQRRGSVVETLDREAKIYEVLDARGNVVGYTFDDAVLSEFTKTSRELRAVERQLGPEPITAASVTSVAACAAGIATFIAMTVFPAFRIARLAWRLLKLVRKYGARLVARIFRGARGIAGRTVEKEILDLAKELAGIAALKACGI